MDNSYKIELARKNFTTHGLSKHPLYSVYRNMINRCENEKTPRYKDYGGRGITVCEEWRNDFIAFYDWCMANGWRKGLQIDRKMNDGNYTPQNCRIVTATINNRNQRTNKLNQEKADEIRSLYQSTAMSLNDLAVVYKVDKALIHQVIKNKVWATQSQLQ